MTKPATHSGTCQCCFRLQKLPGGVLSKHGYTVEYNFFNGTCWGATELPYEQSCEMIKAKIIPAIEADIVRLKEQVRKLRIPGTSNKITVEIELPRERFGKQKYRTEEVEMIVRDKTYSSGETYAELLFIDSEGKEHGAYRFFNLYGTFPKDPVEFVNFRRAGKADYIESTSLKHQTASLAMFKRKVAEWKLAPLTPVESDANE